MTSLRSLCLIAALLAPSMAVAGASRWETVDGGALRVVTADRPDVDGLLRGGLEIRLKPGWKTYWRDPGDAGVPPQLSLIVDGAPPAAVMAFPAPKRFDDGYAVWAGYDADVVLPFTLEVAGAMPGALKADVFIGMCDEICIPVQASLDVDLRSAEGSDIARDAPHELPGAETPDFHASLRGLDADGLQVEATVPSGTGSVELYVAGTSTHILGVPVAAAGSGEMRTFHVPFLSPPAGDGGTRKLAYTLVTDHGAVSGELVLTAK